MYVWIWRHLPGQWPVKALAALGLVAAIAALLWYVVFPWVEPKVQFDRNTVEPGATSSPARP